MTPTVSWWARHQQRVAPALFLAPALALFALYVLWPIGQSLRLSLYDWDGLGTPQWVGLANYAELLHDADFRTALRNNVYWLIGFLLAVPLGLALALFLNQQVFGMRAAKSLFFFPFVISQVVIGLVFTWVYNPELGLIEPVFAFFGKPDFAPLADEDWVTWAVIAAGLYPQVAYCMILYLTGLANVRPDLIEAARLDGASSWRLLWHVVLPQLRPVSFIAVVVTVIGSLRSFDMVSIMTAGGPYGSSRVLAYYMYEQALSEYGYRMGYGTAVASVLFLIMLAYIVWVMSRLARQETRQ